MQQDLLGLFAELCIHTESPGITYPSIQCFYSPSLCTEIQSLIVPPIIYLGMLLSVKFASANLQHSSDLVPGKAQEDVNTRRHFTTSEERVSGENCKPKQLFFDRFRKFHFRSIFIYTVIMKVNLIDSPL